jgi:hypothetical protein
MKTITTILMAGALVLLVSLAMLYGFINFFPKLMEEYYSPVFRSNSYKTDWLFYLHPFVLSAALAWFWDAGQNFFTGSIFIRALKSTLLYVLVAMAPVLLLTFSAIDISPLMVFTWVGYGMVQTLVALWVYAMRSQ